jgi:hypothetical protein
VAFVSWRFGKGRDPMSTPPLKVERRVGQRFPFLIPVLFRQLGSSEGAGFTQDLSSRGAFFFCDAPLAEGSTIELTLRMPSEITLGEDMHVRCKGRVLRVMRPLESLQVSPHRAETKVGVAVRLEEYEYLPECAESVASSSRVSSLHSHPDEERVSPRFGPSRT